jgi:REP element-mobilizing transposase RayT
MPRPRKALVSLDATPYYHCVSRCVRKAFLCGKDSSTGKNYEHRRQWLEDRLLSLAQIFSIDLCAYAVLHNHYHVVLHINQERAHTWSGHEVVERWHQLFAGTSLTQRYAKGDSLDKAELEAIEIKIEQSREQLLDISWFMRCTNEGIARDSNKEDNCSGRFWEGRFKSQALLDEQALAACMAYVDLNPIRAKLTDTPEESEYTSVKRRCDSLKQSQDESIPQQPDNLFPFVGSPREPMPTGLPFHLKDYLELVDWTGRIIREDKRGAIPRNASPILDRLNIEVKHWLFLTTKFESQFRTLVGTAYSVKNACEVLHRKRVTRAAICQI